MFYLQPNICFCRQTVNSKIFFSRESRDRFSGNKTKFREVSTLFDMSLSTMHTSFNKILKFLVTDVASEVIKFPQSIHEKEAIANEFEKPNICFCRQTVNSKIFFSRESRDRFSGNKTKFREVSTLFDMSLSTMHTSFNKILKFLVTDVASEVIKFPQSIHEKEAIANEFEKLADFPNVLGCVASSYIAVRSLKSASADGVSILLQGICDANLRFLGVGTGVPNEILHDAGILKLSPLGKDLPKLCAPQYHLLGDSAYPLREYLLTPYREDDDKMISEAEQNYNLKFRQTHIIANNALRVLKCRFRQLMRLDFQNIETMSQFITSCCVLHNICIEREDFHTEEMLASSESDINKAPAAEDNVGDNLLIQLGHIKRNETKDHLFDLTIN